MRPETYEAIPEGYKSFVAEHPDALLFHSATWLRVISECAGGELQVLSTSDENGLVGVLPLFLSPDKGLGRVANSLPFFGSNGGILATSGREQDVFQTLAPAFEELAQLKNLRAWTMIQGIFDNNDALYREHFKPDVEEERLCQVAVLPGADQLMKSLSPCKRNNVRRAGKLGVTVRASTHSKDLDWLASQHCQRMESMGGTAKPASFFKAAFRELGNKAFTLYMADTKDGQPCAALMVAVHGQTMEYLFPVSDWELREHKGLPFLIHHTMQLAMDQGLKHYNFGGTWASQRSLYEFKQRFGASDFSYKYFTRILDPDLAQHSQEEIVAAFPFYYALPFSMLETQNVADKT